MIRRYGHNRIRLVRTLAVMFVQVLFAYSLPQLLVFLQQPSTTFRIFGR